MFFRSVFSLFSTSLLFLAAHAAPVTSPNDFLAVAPEVTAPSVGSVWTTSTMQTIEWDTSNIPDEAKNYTVNIYLGRITSNPSSENLDLGSPLAQGVPITDGLKEIKVPSSATTGSNYVVVVDGDSGNASEQFTINQTPEDLVNSLL